MIDKEGPTKRVAPQEGVHLTREVFLDELAMKIRGEEHIPLNLATIGFPQFEVWERGLLAHLGGFYVANVPRAMADVMQRHYAVPMGEPFEPNASPLSEIQRGIASRAIKIKEHDIAQAINGTFEPDHGGKNPSRRSFLLPDLQKIVQKIALNSGTVCCLVGVDDRVSLPLMVADQAQGRAKILVAGHGERFEDEFFRQVQDVFSTASPSREIKALRQLISQSFEKNKLFIEQLQAQRRNMGSKQTAALQRDAWSLYWNTVALANDPMQLLSTLPKGSVNALFVDRVMSPLNDDDVRVFLALVNHALSSDGRIVFLEGPKQLAEIGTYSGRILKGFFDPKNVTRLQHPPSFIVLERKNEASERPDANQAAKSNRADTTIYSQGKFVPRQISGPGQPVILEKREFRLFELEERSGIPMREFQDGIDGQTDAWRKANVRLDGTLVVTIYGAEKLIRDISNRTRPDQKLS